jgi:aryl-alcohol dehydrogenase-like predicted oxidoreductase
LETDVIDIYYLHHCDFGPDDIFLEGAVAEVSKLKGEGLIRSVGLSGYSASDLMRVGSVLEPDFIQSWASIEHPEFIRDDGPLASFMKDRNIRFVAMMPYGQGRLLGKYRADDPPTFEAGDNRDGNPEFGARSLADIEPKLAQMRERFGSTPRDLIAPSLGFILKHAIVASVVPGYRNSSQVDDLLAAIARDYTDEDHAFVEAVFPYPPDHPHPWAE